MREWVQTTPWVQRATSGETTIAGHQHTLRERLQHQRTTVISFTMQSVYDAQLSERTGDVLRGAFLPHRECAVFSRCLQQASVRVRHTTCRLLSFLVVVWLDSTPGVRTSFGHLQHMSMSSTMC
jgi:hypothetical protein